MDSVFSSSSSSVIMASKPYVRQWIATDSSLEKLALRLFRKGGSQRTVDTYVEDVLLFTKSLGFRTPGACLSMKYDWVAILNEFLDNQIVRQGMARGTAVRRARAVRKWLQTNGVDFDFSKVELPKVIKTERDVIPTKEELRKLLDACGLCDRVLLLTAISSGLRIGTILRLQLKHIDLDREIPTVMPGAEITKNQRTFVTFLTPEAKQAILTWLKRREMMGEKLTPESYLIASEKRKGKMITNKAGEYRWISVLRRAGLEKRGRKWNTLHFHSLRKFFKSWQALSGVPEEVSEYFMGHRSGLVQTYFLGESETIQPEVVARLEQEYRKAMDHLTVSTDTDKVKELERKLEEQKRSFEDERRKFEEEKAKWEQLFVGWEKTVERMIEQRVRELKSATKTAAATTTPETTTGQEEEDDDYAPLPSQ